MTANISLFLIILSTVLSSQFGGRPWALIALSSLLPLQFLSPRIQTQIASLLLSGLWLAAHQFTGDVRLFFPFTIHFAVQLAIFLPFSPWRSATLGAGGVILLFTCVRLLQGTSLIVLLVELIVAAVAISVPFALYQAGPPTSLRRISTLFLATLLAYLGLIF